MTTDLLKQERRKYNRMFDYPGYRTWTGPERITSFVKHCLGNGPKKVIDFGCGTGINALLLHKAGHDVWMVDIVDNSLLPDARSVLGHRLIIAPLHRMPKELPDADFGFCGDVMEHLPEEWVSKSLAAIKKKVPVCFFLICGIADVWGAKINERLHLTVKPREWWRAEIKKHWTEVNDIAGDNPNVFCFIAGRA